MFEGNGTTSLENPNMQLLIVPSIKFLTMKTKYRILQLSDIYTTIEQAAKRTVK